jgi:4-amino-4-deoxy-L-arabinose transferase-like glycosyltransferase
VASSQRSLIIVLWIVAIAAARIVSTYPQIGITFDEPTHLACGIEHLARHTYHLAPEHPPLARAAAAIGPYLSGVRPTGSTGEVEEGISELYQGGRVRQHLILDRMGILPFFVLACLVVYFWARRHFGNLVAVLAAAIFTLFPPVLGHGGLGTTDMALTAWTGAAFLALFVWAEQPGARRGLLLGCCAGLAALSEFTALVFLPAAAVFACAAWIAAARPHPRHLVKLARERASSLGIAALVAASVVWAGYLFSFGRVADWNISLPAPELFNGLNQVLSHNEATRPAFFFGQVSFEGWWYFFPVMLLLKTPAGLLLLAGAGLSAVWTRRRDARYWLPLALLAGTMAPAMAGRFNVGIRHILPVYAALAILAAIAVERLLRRRGARWLAAALLLWAAASGALHHPDYISYFNEFAPHPETVVADSDLDWGQGSVLLARRLEKLGVAQATCTFWNIQPERLREWPGLDCKPLDPIEPATGWISVSPTAWRVAQYGLDYRIPGHQLWFEDWKPMARIGGQLLYYNPPAPGRGATIAQADRPAYADTQP